jgi:aldose 1-epimerase
MNMKSKCIQLTGGGYTATINISRGANCICLRHENGAALLREPQDPDWLDNPYLYGMPILFPVNRIQGGTFTFEGRQYTFPINEPATRCHLHGVLHETPFTLTEQTDSSVKCRYTATKAAPYLTFPHEFGIVMEYALKEDGFYHTVTVTNLSEQNMPLFLGFHTTFNTLLTPGSRPEDIRVRAAIFEEYARNLDTDYLPTGVKPAFDDISTALANGTYNPFNGKASRHYRGQGLMSITDLGKGLRLVYDNDEKYTFRLIYNGGNDGYICLEPQNCLANCPNSPFSREEAGFSYLIPGESKTFHSKIYIETF